MRTVAYICLIFMVKALVTLAQMPSPFTRELKQTNPPMTGNDVLIAQTLLLRDNHVDPKFVASGKYEADSVAACSAFQSASGLDPTGVLDSASAQKLLDLHSADGVKDTGFTAGSMGYLYKFHVPVHNNRSIETMSTLYDKDNNVVMTFKTRTHGHRESGSYPWPDFGNGDFGLNQFTSSGNTVTGMVEVDLNSPEPDPALYGPWPVNRIVRGLSGNALLLLPNIRDGILIHTGNWTTASTGQWDPTMTMPNSAGCIHTHPSQVEEIYTRLTKLGAVVNPNTFSGKNYPYKPQGIAVIELID